MTLTKLSCSSCGAAYLKELPSGKYQCEYCGAMYHLDVDSNGKLKDAHVSGNMHSGQVFAVHDRLTVSGNMNDVTVVHTAKNAIHVASLKISGNMNDVTVVLLDGATYKISGNMNDVSFK